MILLEDVEKSFGGTPVLRGIDLEVPDASFVAVMGSSGSGKSTLLNLVGGMDRPDSGRILVAGDDISRYRNGQLTLYRRRRVGFVFQFFNLLPNLTVFENIQIPLLLNGRADESRVREYLRAVGLDDRERSYPHQLSGGQQQRVAIARALVHDPDIILADEPTGSLDSRTGEAILDLMDALCRQQGKTVLLVTHETSVAARAQRVVRIRDGVILP